jgi:hypothetical protein
MPDLNQEIKTQANMSIRPTLHHTRLGFGLLFIFLAWPISSAAENYAAHIRSAMLIEADDGYHIATQIDYQLSPTAREALQKGIPLAWESLINISTPGWMWDTAIYSRKLIYILRFNALLNQYEIHNPSGEDEMFLSMNAALNYLSTLPEAPTIDKQLLKNNRTYQLEVKTEFNREFLPVPLRPFAYLDKQWFLSSAWFICPIQK